jgi:hypothetical protein
VVGHWVRAYSRVNSALFWSLFQVINAQASNDTMYGHVVGHWVRAYSRAGSALF